jgi:hypothetical protein
MTYKEAVSHKCNIEYRVNEAWYKLEDRFPIWLPVKDEPSQIFLDTGGEMASCQFLIAELRDDGWLWTKVATNQPFLRSHNQWRLVKKVKW